METQETTMNENESLQLITEMINSTKRNFKEDSYRFLFWGYLFFIACGTYVGMNLTGYSNYAWTGYLIALGLGAVVGVFILIKRRKENKGRSKVKTHLNTIMSNLWMTFGISFFVMTVVLNTYMAKCNDDKAMMVYTPLALMIYGVGIYMSGIVLKFRPLIWGGVSCWVFSILAISLNVTGISAENIQWLCACLALLTGYIIPGHMLRASNEV